MDEKLKNAIELLREYCDKESCKKCKIKDSIHCGCENNKLLYHTPAPSWWNKEN